jgi:hypothetical protein
MPDFETFTKRLVPLENRPYVTIQKRGTISINQAAFDALGEPQAVELLYAPSERIVGLRAVPSSAEHAYPVRTAGPSGHSYLIAGTAFTKHYGIDTELSRRWPADVQDGLLAVDLNHPGTEVTGNRRRTG